ncbi:MAG: LLM class flavin-dependent oxidoreductase [bacterium]|nr:LLM class flavin-dependent oxidoreductase [bacterium]MDE0288386.1 LLM class flavin-dependent oxidoreductase [bacterium]MDE0438714.1 LLM class flavin-dependent oxidoreductase [bacterium]
MGLLSTTSYRRVLEAARWADNVGLVNFAVPDHYLDESPAGRPTLDAFAVLAGLARETAGIELAVMLSPITFRHPAVLAKSAVTIDRMSGGRFLLGVGTGWFELEHTVMGLELPSLDERFDRLEDALGYLGAAFLPEPAAYAGRFYRLERHPVQPPPSRRVRLVVGGTGPIRTPRLAGLHADELNIHSTPVAGVAARVRRAREAAAGAGRDPAGLRISYSSAVVAGRSPSEYRRRLARAARSERVEPDRLERRMAQRNTLHGTYGQVEEVLGLLGEAGVSRFYIQRRLDANLDETGEILEGIGFRAGTARP